MKKKVLVFFPHNIWPPRTGAHKRCLEMIAGLREIGCEVTLASSTLSTDNEWQSSSIQGLKTNIVKDVHVYQATAADHRFIRRLRKFYARDYRFIWRLKNFYPFARSEPPLNSVLYSPPGMRRWFKDVLGESAPDAVLMNYAYWDGLLNHRKLKSVLRIIDTIDIISLNARMQQAVRESLSFPLRVNDIDGHVLKEGFFKEGGFTASREEFHIYDKYNYSIAITTQEADLIKRRTRKTKVVLIPMTQQTIYLSNSYTGPALFPVGPNLFNTQGYLYFVNKVLPKVRKEVPSFSLQVTGFYDNIIPPDLVEGIIFRGFVSELRTVYESSKFVVCPVFGGTGQQVKIVEAMAHGVPVIALREAAGRSPLRHRVNGLVANDADEFADYVIQLWSDEDLCRQLGNAARETIAAEFSRSSLLEGLSAIISP